VGIRGPFRVREKMPSAFLDGIDDTRDGPEVLAVRRRRMDDPLGPVLRHRQPGPSLHQPSQRRQRLEDQPDLQNDDRPADRQEEWLAVGPVSEEVEDHRPRGHDQQERHGHRRDPDAPLEGHEK
jgi:hypothetical protein